MSRATVALDRVLVLVLGLVLLAGGAWVVAWSSGRLPAGWWSTSTFSLGLPTAWTAAAWWPWAVLGVGLLLVLVGLLWFLRHFRSSRVPVLPLAGDGSGGRLLVRDGALADGCAQALVERCPDVVSASGRLLDQRGRMVLDLRAQVRPEADLASVAGACDEVVGYVRRSTGRPDLTSRTRLTVARHPSAPARVV